MKSESVQPGRDIDDGGQAFPHGDETNGGCNGMSLRDWFAGMALGHTTQPFIERINASGVRPGARDVARICYELADAFIAARKEHTL